MPLRLPRPPPVLLAVAVTGILAAAIACWLAYLAAVTLEFVGDTNDMAIRLAAVEDGDSEGWHAIRAPFLTDKWSKSDAAEGWFTLAGVLGIAFLAGYVQYLLGAKHLLSPPRKWVAPVLLVVVWIAQLPFVAFYFSRTVERDCCPWWADSAFIPIGGIVISTFMYLFLVEVIAGFMFLSGTKPGSLLQIRAVTGTRQIVGTLGALVVTIPSLLVLLVGLEGLAAVVPLGVTGIWAVLVARSSLIEGTDLRIPI